jgi:hypothetical protein
MPRKYSRSSKSLRSRRSLRIRRQRGGGVFEFVVAYTGDASAGDAKLEALKARFNPPATNIVESPAPPPSPTFAPPAAGKVQFKWSITTPANSLTHTQLSSAVQGLSGANAISGFEAQAIIPPPASTTNGPAAEAASRVAERAALAVTASAAAAVAAAAARRVETPSNDPNVAEIYLFVDPASTNPVRPPNIIKERNPFSTKTNLTGTVNYIDTQQYTQGISIVHPSSKKISKVQFSPILVSSSTTTPQRFSIEDSAELTGNSLEKLYTSPTTSNPGILILPKLTDPTMYGSGTTKNWAKSVSQETQNILPSPVPGYQGIIPNLKITLTFVNV